MFLYIITWTIIYFILIFLLHNLYLFFQKNLTTTITKDYYNLPNNEYNKINSILNSNTNTNTNTNTNSKFNDKKNINNQTNNNIKQISTSINNSKQNSKYSNNESKNKSNTFSDVDYSLTSNQIYNNDAKIFPNYNVNLTTTNVETNLKKNDTFDIEKFNTQFENNNMKGELEEFLNKLNN
tara:strand:+ start:446 stop:988 length:543 start_codon:yes stop_codon:yes gene_type:complete